MDNQRRMQIRQKIKTMIHTNLKSKEYSLIKDVLKTLSDKDKIDDYAELFILEYIESIIINTTNQACRIARARKSQYLEKKDMDYAIRMQSGDQRVRSKTQRDQNAMNARGELENEIDEIYNSIKEPASEHLENMELLKQFQEAKRKQGNS